MKLIQKLCPVIAMLVLGILTGCDTRIADRQSVVDEFHTSEVVDIPGGYDKTYLVKDTNGAIWFVSRNRSSGPAKTKIFDAK